jgi:hypothetical protein
MEYQVPQFIEVEDKIFGPLTLKQFIYMAGGAGLSVIVFLYLPLFLALLFIIPVMGFAFALAFYKVNNRNFTDMLSAGFTFYTKDRLYLWKKEEKNESAPMPVAIAAPEREKLNLSGGRLHDLALSLDIQDRNTPSE